MRKLFSSHTFHNCKNVLAPIAEQCICIDLMDVTTAVFHSKLKENVLVIDMDISGGYGFLCLSN